jgi:hypothetical protein
MVELSADTWSHGLDAPVAMVKGTPGIDADTVTLWSNGDAPAVAVKARLVVET